MPILVAMIFQVFAVSFGISLLGTIPPATINITVMQLSLTKRSRSAYFLSMGAAIPDTIYASLAVQIQIYLSRQLEFTNYFYLITALVLGILGAVSIKSKTSSAEIETKSPGKMGFLKGVVLGALNPLAMKLVKSYGNTELKLLTARRICFIISIVSIEI